MKWIRTRDKMPDLQCNILFLNGKMKHLGLFLSDDCWFSYINGIFFKNNQASHWLRTPALPEECLHGSRLNEDEL